MKKLIVVFTGCIVLLVANVTTAFCSIEEESALTPVSTTQAQTFCFIRYVDADHLFTLTFDGQFITGIYQSPECDATVLGDIIGNQFAFYRDFPSDSTCLEGVWYTGQLSDYTYEWINTNGSTGTGQLIPVPCP